MDCPDYGLLSLQLSTSVQLRYSMPCVLGIVVRLHSLPIRGGLACFARTAEVGQGSGELMSENA